MQPRPSTIVALALAGASFAGMALATGEWRIGLGALTATAAGAFGGLLDAEGPAAPPGDALVRAAKEGPAAPPGDALVRAAKGSPAAPRRTIMLLGVLSYLVLVPVLGFTARGLEELGLAARGWWILAVIDVSDFLVAFLGARSWQRDRAERSPAPLAATAVTR